MALNGTLGDFALTDILQLIGLQRKSGLLVLEREGERVTIGFDAGRVVSADSTARPFDLRVGQLLVRSGKLTEKRLQEALSIQKKTLQQLGHVLLRNGWIDKDTLRAQLVLQVRETVYELFRWKAGRYDFQPERKVAWDHELMTPIPSETLLMEGAQMVDEWPMIERVIPSPSVVLAPTAAAAQLLATKDAKEARGSIYEQDLDFGFIPENPLADAGGQGPGRVSDHELSVLRWVDGQRTAGEIAELTGFGSFETYKLLARLIEQRLIEVSRGARDGRRARRGLAERPGVARLVLSLTVAASAIGAASIALDVARALVPRLEIPVPDRPGLATPEELVEAAGLDLARIAADRRRIERLEQAVRAFLLDQQRWPQGFGELERAGLVSGPELRDPWGRGYMLALAPDGFGVAGASRPATMRRVTSVEASLPR
ncbi:MAG: hypothetical protein Kow0062_05340 [Acidobacteriota bacterium]